MKFLAKIDPRTQVHALWRLQDRKKALLYSILFELNPATKEYEAKELNNMQIKIARQYPAIIRLETISGDHWEGPVPLNPKESIYDTYKNPLADRVEKMDGTGKFKPVGGTVPSESETVSVTSPLEPEKTADFAPDGSVRKMPARRGRRGR